VCAFSPARLLSHLRQENNKFFMIETVNKSKEKGFVEAPARFSIGDENMRT